MKRSAIAAVAAVLLLTLTGCAGATDAAPSEPQAPAPLVASPEAEQPVDTPEAEFVAKAREALGDASQIPDATDDQLIAAGEDACQQLAEGKTPEEVRVIEGEAPNSAGWYSDSTKIATIAGQILCG